MSLSKLGDIFNFLAKKGEIMFYDLKRSKVKFFCVDDKKPIISGRSLNIIMAEIKLINLKSPFLFLALI